MALLQRQEKTCVSKQSRIAKVGQFSWSSFRVCLILLMAVIKTQCLCSNHILYYIQQLTNRISSSTVCQHRTVRNSTIKTTFTKHSYELAAEKKVIKNCTFVLALFYGQDKWTLLVPDSNFKYILYKLLQLRTNSRMYIVQSSNSIQDYIQNSLHTFH